MPASPASCDTKPASRRGTGQANLQDLIRLLLKEVSTGNGHSSEAAQDFGAEEIILDTEIDGERYLVLHLPKPAQGQVRLSPREQEIVRMVAQGHSNKIIADVLSISAWTVCTHLRRVFGKLGVGSRAAMVARLPEIARTRSLNDHKSSAPEMSPWRPTPRIPSPDASRQPSLSTRTEVTTRRSR